jgi:hypothetical protein
MNSQKDSRYRCPQCKLSCVELVRDMGFEEVIAEVVKRGGCGVKGKMRVGMIEGSDRAMWVEIQEGQQKIVSYRDKWMTYPEYQALISQ